MFTGIVEAIGTIIAVTPAAGGQQLRVETRLADELNPGDSVAVNGVCLTVVGHGPREFHADIGPETARATTLGGLCVGHGVNLERPMRASDRFGGHIVLGHVDAVGTVDSVRAEADAHWVRVAFPAALGPFFIRKGSVTVDGVSLTVAGLSDTHFDVQVIPYTWQHTTLGAAVVGDRVNLECDMIGKYVVRTLEQLRPGTRHE